MELNFNQKLIAAYMAVGLAYLAWDLVKFYGLTSPLEREDRYNKVLIKSNGVDIGVTAMVVFYSLLTPLIWPVTLYVKIRREFTGKG